MFKYLTFLKIMFVVAVNCSYSAIVHRLVLATFYLCRPFSLFFGTKITTLSVLQFKAVQDQLSIQGWSGTPMRKAKIL